MQEVFESLVKSPPWITKYGISTLFLILLVIVVLLTQIPFNDVVSGTAKLNPTLSSIEIRTEDYPKIEKGQNVFINVTNHSNNSNISITGKVKQIKKDEDKSTSLYINVAIDIDSLTYNNAIKQGFSESILGEGHILIGKKSLFQRVFQPL